MRFGNQTRLRSADTAAITFTPQLGTSGDDNLIGGSNFDILIGQAGNDILEGLGGLDILVGGADNDVLAGGAGMDILIGGRGGDSYVVATSDGGTDIINDKGDAPVINGYYSSNLDTLALDGFVSVNEAIHSVDFEISGDDLIVSYVNDGAGTSGQITITNHFLDPASAIEALDFGNGAVYHVSTLSSDNYTYSVHSGPDAGGEDIVIGTALDDEIYGGIGGDILIGGTGADHFMFHDEEEANGAHDIILDFEGGVDVIDFTDIKTLDASGVSVSDNAYGNAVISTAYGTIELDGIASNAVSEQDFLFFG